MSPKRRRRGAGQNSSTRPTSLAQPKPGWFSFVPLRLGVATLVVLLLLVFGSISTLAVSAGSLPGDALYPVKLLSEKTQLFFTQDSNQRLELERNFDQLRAAEVQELIVRSRSQTVNFAGEITQVGSNEWVVNGIRLVIAPGTEVVDELREGLYVGIEGILGDDGLVLVRRVWAREYQIEGVVEAAYGDRWIVDGIEVFLTSETIIHGLPTVGARVVVQASLSLDGQFLARTVQVIGADPEVTGTSQPTWTDQPISTVEPSDTPEPTDEDDTSEPEDTDEPEDTPEPTDDDDDDDDDEATKTPKPTDDDDDDDELPTRRSPRTTMMTMTTMMTTDA